ncbi:MAG: hydroxymethylbilane synthase [Leptospirales bacterium]
MPQPVLRIGTRGSELALWQARHVAASIKTRFGVESELLIIKTSGDIILDRALSEVGGKGLFVKEIEEALLRKEIDLAVHSMKDVPAFLPDGLVLAATLEREDPRDAYLSPKFPTILSLPLKARVGTSSLRRLSQIREFRDDLEFVPLRGNVGTRLRKLGEGVVDALILAGAGLKRLGFEDQIREWIRPEVLLPAIGQGALGLEIRQDDPVIQSMVRSLSHDRTHLCVAAERGVLKSLNGGCQVPIAAFGQWNEDGTLTLEGRVLNLSGTKRVQSEARAIVQNEHEAEQMGMALGADLLSRGGREILSDILSPSR